MTIGIGRLSAAAVVGVVLWTGLGWAADENPQVAALGDNSWLKLETPRIHPITRSSSPWMAAKRFPIDRANVWALDVEKQEWVMQPRPANGLLPVIDRQSGCVHHFYDPAHNATLVFRGTYNGTNGETWVYRYKRATRRSTR